MENQELMVVTQLPIIKERLKQLSEEVDIKVKNAEALVCTEENVKIVKQVRADLNKELREVEQQRKAIKEQVLAPYMQFEDAYKQYISDKYRNADVILGGRIKVVEDELKKQKEQEIKEYFEELKQEKNIDFITYEQANINITLTASKKSLREQVENFINKISDDLKLIETQENKAEIMVEYRKDLNVSRAITEVVNRKEAVKIEEKKQEEQKVVHIEMNKNHEITKESYEQLEEVFMPQQEKIYTITFTVKGTAPKLKQLKDYLIKEGYQYE